MANEPRLKTEFANIYDHRNADKIAPGQTSAVTYAPDEKATPMDILQTPSTDQLRGLFKAIADIPSSDSKGSLIIFHAHVVHGPRGENSQHIEKQKTYVPHPNMNLADTIKVKSENTPATVNGVNGFGHITLSKEEGGEAASHKIITHKGFSSLKDFADNASDIQLEIFRCNLASLINPLTGEGKGGARIIIDERYTNTGMLTVQVIGGEDLGQVAGARWFQDPAKLAPK